MEVLNVYTYTNESQGTYDQTRSLSYRCASGMSFMSTDTKGDILRNYGNIAQRDYGYHISVIDLRNPMRSHGNNLLHLVNKYMDLYAKHPEVLAYKAKAEKYAKIISKTIILSGMEASSFGQNAYFYDAAEGLLTASILLVSEFCPKEERHIVSVFKIIQELLEPSKGMRGKNQFQTLMELLPPEHKAKWFAGAALNTSEQSMASVLSTALSRLNAFLDSELETILCNDTEIDAEEFCKNKSAIFIIMPEEDSSKYFMVCIFLLTVRAYISQSATKAKPETKYGYYHSLKEAADKGMFEMGAVATTNYNRFIEEILNTQVSFLNGSTETWYDPYLNKIGNKDSIITDENHILVPLLFTQSGTKPMTSIEMSIAYVRTYQEWKKADKIVIVGFGFGADDEHINGIIRSLIDSDNKAVEIVTIQSGKTENQLAKDYALKLKTSKYENVTVIQVDAQGKTADGKIWTEAI